MTAIGLILSIIGVIPVLAAVWYWFQRFQRGRRILQFSRTAPIDIVLTTSSVTRAAHGLPARRPTTGYGQVHAVASCARALATLYPRKEIVVHLSGFIRNRLDRDLVVLGGPAKNEAAKAVLDDFEAQYDLAEFSFDDVNDSLAIKSPGGDRHYEVSNFSPQMQSSLPVTDYALIIANYRDGRMGKRCRSILCAGSTTYGTAAAADYVFGDLMRLSRRQLHKRIGIKSYQKVQAFVIVVFARFSRGECTQLDPRFHLVVRKRDLTGRRVAAPLPVLGR